MATIRERPGRDGKPVFHVQVRLRGHPAETASFPTKSKAKDWAARTESAMKEGRHFKVSEAKRHTFQELVDWYIKTELPKKNQDNRHSTKHQLEWWRERLGPYTLADVTPARIAAAREELAAQVTRFKKPTAPATVNRYLAALSHVLTKAVRDKGWLDSNPVEKVDRPKESQGRVRFLSDEERNKLLEQCGKSRCKDLPDVVVLAITTGMRQGELRGIRWGDVDFTRGTILLEHTKNNERRAAPLVGPALAMLQRRAKVRRLDTDLVFPGPFRRGEVTLPLDFANAFTTAVRKAGLQDFHYHDLRHCCASYLAMSGATTYEIANVLGHKTLQMVKRYSHLSETHVNTVVARMARAVFAEPAAESTESTGGTEHAAG